MIFVKKCYLVNKMKALFCTDGSDISFNALKNAHHWVGNAQVDIISVVDLNFLPEEINIEAPEFYDFCTDSADGILKLAQKKAQEIGFKPGEIIKHCGLAASSILEELEENKQDLVILGSHGKKGVRKWLGSVSNDIVTHSKTCAYISKFENEGQKVLFPVDGSKVSAEGIVEAISHLELKGKEIYICMVNEEPDLLFLEGTLDPNWLLQIEQRQEAYAERAINTVKDIILANGYEVKETAVLTGNPAQKILDYSHEKEIDLILLSSKHKEEKKTFLNNSICKRVLENSDADVIIAKKNNHG